MKTAANGFFAILLCIGALAGPARADEVRSSFLEVLRRAPLVFEGEVVDVSYGSSRATADGRPGLAHTFVTYRVDWVHHGTVVPSPRRGTRDASPAPELTLRFMGGLESDDTFSLLSGTPLFDVGDRDLLMVRGNGELACPLVSCRLGRYRFIDGHVYNDDGQEVIATGFDPVRYGVPRYPREVMTHRMGALELAIVQVEEAGEADTSAPQPYGSHYDVESFREHLRRMIAELGADGLLAPPVPVSSLAIGESFEVAGAEPVSEAPVGRDDATPGDPGFLLADRLELHLIRRNGDNPVLDPRISRALQHLRVGEMRRLASAERRKARGRGRP